MVEQSHEQAGSAWEVEVVLVLVVVGGVCGGGREAACRCRHTNAVLDFSPPDVATVAAASGCVAAVSGVSPCVSSPVVTPPTLFCLHFSLPVLKSKPPLPLPPSLPPLCHFEKLQYATGTLTDTDASPIRCTFLFDSVFGCAPPCPNLLPPCKEIKQKKQKDST